MSVETYFLAGLHEFPGFFAAPVTFVGTAGAGDNLDLLPILDPSFFVAGAEFLATFDRGAGFLATFDRGAGFCVATFARPVDFGAVVFGSFRVLSGEVVERSAFFFAAFIGAPDAVATAFIGATVERGVTRFAFETDLFASVLSERFAADVVKAVGTVGAVETVRTLAPVTPFGTVELSSFTAGKRCSVDSISPTGTLT